MKFEIKHRLSARIIFSFETVSFKTCVEAAVRAGVDLSYADLSNADLSYAKLRFADLSNADLSHGKLRYADLRNADLSYADLSYADLRNADLRYAKLRYAKLRYADLSYADLSYADLRNANLRYADLRYAKLRYAKLRYADLSYADLSNADLSHGKLRYADLRNADLSYADLSYADLSNADLGLIKDDFINILSSAPNEVPALIDALKNGEIDGSFYQGDCACLIGTIANARGCDYKNLGTIQPDVSRPAERFFLAIRTGDTPETNQVSRVALEWAEEWLAQRTNNGGDRNGIG